MIQRLNKINLMKEITDQVTRKQRNIDEILKLRRINNIYIINECD